MNATKPPNELPLIDLFWHLRDAGLPLTIAQYDLAVRALQQAIEGGLDISNRAAVARVYRAVWVKSRREKFVFERCFDDFEAKLDRDAAEVDRILPIENKTTQTQTPEKAIPETPDIPENLEPSPTLSDDGEAIPETSDIPENLEPSPTLSDDGQNIDIGRAIRRRRNLPPPETDYFPISSQQMLAQWQQLSQPNNRSQPAGIDLKATIRDVARRGFFVAPVRDRSARQSRVLLLVDRSDSMTPVSPLMRQLIATWQRAGLRTDDIYYFRNCPPRLPQLFLEFGLYRDRQCWNAEPLNSLLSNVTRDRTSAVIFSDAGAARRAYNSDRIDTTDEFLQALLTRVRRVAWLNPLPEERWQDTTAAEISEFAREIDPNGEMFSLTSFPQMVQWLAQINSIAPKREEVPELGEADEAELEEEPDNPWSAISQIDRFHRKFGEPHLHLACHAAFPLALTPDLLYGLWWQFFEKPSGQPSQAPTLNSPLDLATLNSPLVKGGWGGSPPWYAVADILLSPLCQNADTELYELPSAIRNELLKRLTQEYQHTFGESRLQELCDYLLKSIRNQISGNAADTSLAQAQEWTALAYTKPNEAAKQLAAALQQAYGDGNRAELVRLSALAETLTEPLADYEPLLVVARGYGATAREDAQGIEAARQETQRQTGENEAIEVEGVRLFLPGKIVWHTFEFEVVTVNRRGKVIERQQETAEYFVEDLGDGITLEMVAIPGGSFIMGAPGSETGSYDSERPQHQVSVPPFCMGKYPVTQAQWQIVASLPQVDRPLDPNPARFKGDNCPVDRVSWYDAMEFCTRLSQLTGREYRLPSEAEWEYACRAGTTTPFSFGETITSDLANYHGNYTYDKEPQGQYHKQTISVGRFPPNSFGLYDLHGNVWEWCADDWHENYLNAPSDGSIWSFSESWCQCKVLRGGSWYVGPNNCRSGYRYFNLSAVAVNYFIGFRVVCAAPRGLLCP